MKWLVHVATVLGESDIYNEAQQTLLDAAGRLGGSGNGAEEATGGRAALGFARGTVQYSVFTAAQGADAVTAGSRAALETSIESIRGALGLVHSRDVGADCAVLVPLCWRTMLKFPASVDPLIRDPAWRGALEKGLELLADVGVQTLKLCKALRQRKALDGALLAVVADIEKLEPLIQSSIVDALVKAASLCSSDASGGSVARAVQFLGRAEGCVVEPVHFRRVAHSYSLLGKALSGLGSPKDAAGPLLRACALLEDLVAAAKTDEARLELLEEFKLSQRLVALGNVFLQGGARGAALRVFRHAACRSTEAAAGGSSFALIERFVRAQFRGDSEGSGLGEEVPSAPGFMAALAGDAESEAAGFLAVCSAAEALPLPGSARASMASDELRAQVLVLEDLLESRGALDPAVLDALLAYHEQTLGHLTASAGACDLQRCAALVDSARFCHYAARASLPSDLLVRVVKDLGGDRGAAQFEEFGRAADAPEVRGGGAPPLGDEVGLSSGELAARATARLAAAFEALRSAEGGGGAHTSRAAAVERARAHLVDGMVSRAAGAGRRNVEASPYDAALDSLGVAVGDPHVPMDCACRCMNGHELRAADIARSLCDYFSSAGQTWKQVGSRCSRVPRAPSSKSIAQETARKI